MVTVITGILIVLYCLYNTILIDEFILKSETGIDEKYESIGDAFIFMFIVIWLIIQFFMQSSFIALVPLPLLLVKPVNYLKSIRLTRLFYYTVLISITLTVSFIVLNKLYFNINLWTICM